MGEIVNLRQVRKQRERAAKQAQAAENRAVHGQTAAAKHLDQRERDRRRDLLDQAKIETEPKREL